MPSTAWQTIARVNTQQFKAGDQILFEGGAPAVAVWAGSANLFMNNIFEVAAHGVNAATISTPDCLFLENDYWGQSGPAKLSNLGSTLATLAEFQRAGRETWRGQLFGFAVNPKLRAPGGGGAVNSGQPSSMTCYVPDPGSPMLGTGLAPSNLGFALGANDFYLKPVPPIDVGRD